MVYALFSFTGSNIIPLLLWICLILGACAIMGAYFAFRYFALKHALCGLNRDLREMQADLTRNRILHLPLPDRDLEAFVLSVNATLEQIRLERQAYAGREREFQKQIENISHDLRTPLTVILGYLKWMKQENAGRKGPLAECRPDQAEFLDIIEQNARSMERLVSQFYAFCLLNGQDYKPEIGETDLCRLLRESLASNYQILEAASIRPDCLLPEHPVPVLGDPDALERIFANLFQNAARYAHSFLRIRLENTEGGRVRVFLLNDTEKLKAQDIPHLFDRFYRGDPARNRSGSGLGLTIAKSLAEKMGGSLEAEPVQAWQTEKQACKEPESADGNGFPRKQAKKADGTTLTVCFVLTLVPAP